VGKVGGSIPSQSFAMVFLFRNMKKRFLFEANMFLNKIWLPSEEGLSSF
jgi:hypothetical protein